MIEIIENLTYIFLLFLQYMYILKKKKKIYLIKNKMTKKFDQNIIKELVIQLIILDLPLKTFLRTLPTKDKQDTEKLINKHKDLWNEYMKKYTNFKKIATHIKQSNTSLKEFLKIVPKEISDEIKKHKMGFNKILKGIKQKTQDKQTPNLQKIIQNQKKLEQNLINSGSLSNKIEEQTRKAYQRQAEMLFEDHFLTLPKKIKDMLKEKKKRLTIPQFEELSDRQAKIYADYEELNKLLQKIIGKNGTNRDLGNYDILIGKIEKQLQQKQAKKSK